MKLINLKRNETALREAMGFIDWIGEHEAEYFRCIAKYLSYEQAVQFHDRMREAGATRERLRKELVG